MTTGFTGKKGGFLCTRSIPSLLQTTYLVTRDQVLYSYTCESMLLWLVRVNVKLHTIKNTQCRETLDDT